MFWTNRGPNRIQETDHPYRLVVENKGGKKPSFNLISANGSKLRRVNGIGVYISHGNGRTRTTLEWFGDVPCYTNDGWNFYPVSETDVIYV